MIKCICFKENILCHNFLVAHPVKLLNTPPAYKVVHLPACLGNGDPGVLLADEVDVPVGEVLAHDQAAVVALGVVPADEHKINK